MSSIMIGSKADRKTLFKIHKFKIKSIELDNNLNERNE
jgi:hypothetical protein